MCDEADKKDLIWIPPSGGDNIDIPEDASFKTEPGGYLLMPERMKILDRKTDFLILLMSGVIVVLLSGLAGVIATLTGILTDGWRQNVNSYIDYQNSIYENTENFNLINSDLYEITNSLDHLQDRTANIENQLSHSEIE